MPLPYGARLPSRPHLYVFSAASAPIFGRNNIGIKILATRSKQRPISISNRNKTHMGSLLQ